MFLSTIEFNVLFKRLTILIWDLGVKHARVYIDVRNIQVTVDASLCVALRDLNSQPLSLLKDNYRKHYSTLLLNKNTKFIVN